MADGHRSGPYGSHPPRRLSYASVASGAAPQNVPYPSRSGIIANMATSPPSSSYPPPQQQDPRFHRRQSSHDQDVSTSTGISWRKPASLPAYSRRFNGLPGLGLGPSPSNPFFVPSYLRRSRYVAKLEAEHAARIRRERQQPHGLPSNPPSLSSSATTSNVHRIAPSHRGMTYDIIESNPPKDEDHLMPLPSRWSDLDKYPGLDITNSGLDVKYSGAASKADIEAASVRADYPMSPACGIHYFEVTVKSKNKDCAIAVGFSTAQASLERLPGWETHSWGYHGDDGKMFSGEHAGRHYGPNFSAEDVVGCGINFNTGQAFFTMNGKDLDVCFRDLKEVKPFPTVGMKKYSGASVSVNFGQKPFLFDIEEKMLEEEAAVDQEIAAAKTSSLRPGLDENSLIQELVAQYLAHDGYVETAKAFQEETTREKNALNSAQPGTTVNTPHVDNAEAMHRQQIRSAILEGDIDRALEITEDHFPNVLKASPQIVFRMKCRKWVELISKANDLRAREDMAPKSRRISNGYSKTSAVADEFAQDMELDEQPRGDANGTKGGTIDSARNPQYDRLLAEAMEYGQVLQRDYRDSPDAEQGKALLDIFSLVAYDNPRESVHGSLLDRKGRVAVAEELNSAILVSLGRSPAAALEKMWRQTEALVDELSKEGSPAAFVNIQAKFSAPTSED